MNKCQTGGKSEWHAGQCGGWERVNIKRPVDFENYQCTENFRKVRACAHTFSLTLVSDEYRDDKTIYSNDTGHNNRDNRLHDEIWSHYTHGSNTSATLSCTIGCSKCCKGGEGREIDRERDR